MIAQLPSGRPLTLALGVTQTIGYAASAYLPAVLARPMAAALGLPVALIYLAFSCALLLQVFMGPAIGRWVDDHGGRGMLLVGSASFVLGLYVLAGAQTAWQVFLGWLIVGVGMEVGLYDVAFAVLVRLQGASARAAITGVTLIAGFASTISWPLTTWMVTEWGWREACLAWAGANLIICAPIHALTPQGDRPQPEIPTVAFSGPPVEQRGAFALVALAFATFFAVNSVMIAHMPALLETLGASSAAAIAASALVGPAQVGARLAEFSLARKVQPLSAIRATACAFPAGAALLLCLGPVAAAPFALLYGAGNGAFSILRGTLPLALFGPAGFGGRLGRLMIASRLVQAIAPVTFSLFMAEHPRAALVVLTVIAATGAVALGLIRTRR